MNFRLRRIRKVVLNLILKRRSVRVCLPGAWSPEFRRRDGTLPGRGVFPRRAKRALSRSSSTHAPLNGRASILWRKSFRISRARALFARARVTLKVRDDKIRLIERLHSKSLIYRVEVSFLENVRVSCMPGEHSPTGECFGLSPVCRRTRTRGMHLRCLYGFMRCKIIPCISSVVCARYIIEKYSNCPVSWCKPVGLAEVRTLKSLSYGAERHKFKK